MVLISPLTESTSHKYVECNTANTWTAESEASSVPIHSGTIILVIVTARAELEI
jgi:hypothetical protein